MKGESSGYALERSVSLSKKIPSLPPIKIKRKREKTMATTMTPAGEKLTAKKKVFDLDKFEKVTKTVEYSRPTPLKSMDEVLNLDEKTVLSIVNLGLVRNAWKEARNSIQGVSPKIINQFVNVWRMLPPYSEMTEKDSDGSVTKESRRKQTQAIYAFIKSQESILNSLKQAAANATPDEDEDEDDNEE